MELFEGLASIETIGAIPQNGKKKLRFFYRFGKVDL